MFGGVVYSCGRCHDFYGCGVSLGQMTSITGISGFSLFRGPSLCCPTCVVIFLPPGWDKAFVPFVVTSRESLLALRGAISSTHECPNETSGWGGGGLDYGAELTQTQHPDDDGSAAVGDMHAPPSLRTWSKGRGARAGSAASSTGPGEHPWFPCSECNNKHQDSICQQCWLV